MAEKHRGHDRERPRLEPSRGNFRNMAHLRDDGRHLLSAGSCAQLLRVPHEVPEPPAHVGPDGQFRHPSRQMHRTCRPQSNWDPEKSLKAEVPRASPSTQRGYPFCS